MNVQYNEQIFITLFLKIIIGENIIFFKIVKNYAQYSTGYH